MPSGFAEWLAGHGDPAMRAVLARLGPDQTAALDGHDAGQLRAALPAIGLAPEDRATLEAAMDAFEAERPEAKTGPEAGAETAGSSGDGREPTEADKPRRLMPEDFGAWLNRKARSDRGIGRLVQSDVFRGLDVSLRDGVFRGREPETIRAAVMSAVPVSAQQTALLALIDLYANAYCDTPSEVFTGRIDSAGNVIGRVYTKTEKYAIYAVDDPLTRDDPAGLRCILPESYEEAKALRRQAVSIAPQIAYISDMIAGMVPVRWWPERGTYASLRERSLELMARATAYAYEGEADEAKAILLKLREELEARRDSQSRMRYVWSNTVFFILFIFIGFFVIRDPSNAKDASAFFNYAVLTTPGGPTVHVIDMLMLGALGAFFSVSLDLKSIRIGHTLSLSEMLYTGLVRIPIGIIAAGVTIHLIKGDWILGAIEAGLKPWAFYLFGFIAGFSEYFVPNALKKIGGETEVRRPDTPPGAGSGA